MVKEGAVEEVKRSRKGQSRKSVEEGASEEGASDLATSVKI